MKNLLIKKLVKKVLNETHEKNNDRYMFFSNLEQIHRQTEILLQENEEQIHSILENGHDWAQDHIATAKESIDQVFDFLMNETKSPENNFTDNMNYHEDIVGESEELTEKKKKNTATNQKLWKASLAWAKSRYKVCPSAYCNGAAVKHYNSKGGNWVKK
jgi:hypothetical protein